MQVPDRCRRSAWLLALYGTYPACLYAAVYDGWEHHQRIPANYSALCHPHTSATAITAPSPGSFARCRCYSSISNALLLPVLPMSFSRYGFACACLPTHVRPTCLEQPLHAEPDDVRTFQTAATGLHVRVFRSDADQLSHVDGANRKTRAAEFRFSLLFKGPFARASRERWKRRDRYSLMSRSRDFALRTSCSERISKYGRHHNYHRVVVVGT